MATNRTLQQKRKSGCLKGGAAAASEQSQWAVGTSAGAPSMPQLHPEQQQQHYALAAVSGLKIRLMRKDSQSAGGCSDPDATATVETSAEPAVSSPEAAVEPAAADESDSEELLEEEGDDSDGFEAEATPGHPDEQQPAGDDAPPAVPTCAIDFGSGGNGQAVIVATIDANSAGVSPRRLTLVATLPAPACDDAAEQPLATLRGLALAGLAERLFERRLALVAEATEAAGPPGELLLLLPASRLPWPSLAVRRLPVPERPPPDWWLEWDGPPSDVNLNCLRRTNAFMQQFPDQTPR